ncbi:MAG: lipoate--protein ligase family protein, partial [Actinomycetota bacterium]|nr:lipoate--protein ligase family protein [Actinomycetota bacterium]
MGEPWRLLSADGPKDGAWNMAVDRAIQLACAAGAAPPTLRLYTWARPTVTLGRFQPASSVQADACGRYGVGVVRRFTGGRGVLHDDEVTYSIVASVPDGVPRGVAASYRYLCTGLTEAYHLL